MKKNIQIITDIFSDMSAENRSTFICIAKIAHKLLTIAHENEHVPISRMSREIGTIGFGLCNKIAQAFGMELKYIKSSKIARRPMRAWVKSENKRN